MEIGSVQEELILKCSNIKIRLEDGTEIVVLDSNGNPNIRLKNLVNEGTPTNGARNGVYFDSSSQTLYIKTDSGIFPVLQKSSQLPEGTILLYQGSIAPTGWNAYDEETGMEGVIYITNGSSTSGGRTRVELYFIDNPDTTVEVGDTTYEFPQVGVRYRGSQTPYDGEWSSNEISYLSTNTTVANMINDSLNPRKYGATTIRITLPQNEYHTDASITYQLQVNRKQISGLRFLVPTMTIQEGTSHNFKVDLTGIDSNLIDNEVIFKDNNTNVTYSMPAMLSAGTYYIKALLPQNDYHTSCDGGILSLTVESVLQSISPTVSLTGWTYGNAPYDPQVTGNLGNGTVTYSYKLSTADDSTYTSTKPSNAGTYTVRAQIAETASYASGVCTSTFTISKANISPIVTMIGWTEGSTASNPSITGNLGNGTVTYSYKLSTAADSSYITTKPSSVGTYIIRAQIAETTNYNSGVCTASFSIVDRTKLNINPIVSISNWTYGETASNPSISGNTGNGSVSYSYKLSTASDNEYTSTKPSDAGTYIIRAVISETSDYNGATVTSSFTIGKANISPTVTMANWTYGTVASNPSVTGNTGGGQITYSYRLDTESNYYGTKPTNAGSYIVRAQIAATSNYNSGTATASFTINKAYRSAFVVEMDGWKYGETSHNPSVSGNLENGIVTYEYKIQGGTYSSNQPESTSTPGTYYVKATAAPTTNYYLAVAENTFTISKANGSVTISGVSLSYTGSAQNLVTVSNNTGTMHYRLGTNGSWTTTPPSASAQGNYTIYYYMDASAICEGIGSSSNPRSVTSSISSSSPSYTAPTAKTGLTYNGNSQQLLNAGSTNDGTIYYSSDGSNWSQNIPTATNASDSITVYWKLIGDSNHSDVSSQSITCSIGKVQATYTTNPTANSNLVYDGTAKPLLSDGGTTSDGTIQYSIDNTNWSSNIPTATNAGEYTVYWKIVPDSNHIAVTGNATITIGQEAISMSVSVLENQVNEQSQGTDNSKSKVVIVNNSSYHINGIKFHIAQNGVWSDANDVTLSTTCDPNTQVELETTNLDGKTPYNEDWATNYNVSILTSDLDANQEYYVRIEAQTNVQSYANGRCYTFTVGDQGVTFANSENSGTINTPSDSKIAINVKNNTNNNITVNKVEFKVSDNGNTVSTDKLSISSSAITVNSNSTSSNYEITIPSNCRGNKSFANVANIILYDSNNDSVISIQATGTFKMGALYTINYGEVSSSAIFDELLGEFNNVLYGNDTTDNRRIKSNNKANVYNYLHDMFMIADSEYKKNISANDSLFNPELYTEPTNYRKTSSDSGYADGDNETYKTMQAWLMATCLAELVTTTSSQTNIQTELFNKAYSLGKQNIYTTTSVNNEQIVSSNCYGIKQDPMIARYVATMIYAFNHDSKETDINNCRQAFESKYITINSTLFDNYTDNRDLGTLWGYNRGTNIGYFVNGDDIFGTPAGPFENNNTKSGDLFYGGNHTYDKYWYDYNYKMDVAIDAKVREIYNMYDDNGTTTASTFTNQNSNLTPSERKKIKQAIVDASIVPGTQHFMWFGKKIIKFDSVINVNNVTINNRNTNLVLHKFVNCTPSDIPSDSNDVYEYVGPYYLGDVDSNLKNIWYTNSSGVNPVYDYESDDSLQGTMTSYMEFMRRIQNLADRHREFSYDKGYGRMRPLWNSDQGKSRGEIVSVGYSGSDSDVSQASTYNGLSKHYAQALLADSRTGDNGHDSIISDLDNRTFIISDDFPADPANSWPSGHASQTWAPAMYLCQMFGNNSNTWNIRKQIIKQSYRLGSLRSIARFHWNSDILFGRLYATMLLPILNATKTLFTNYNSLKTALIGSSNISAIDDSSYTEGGDTDTQSGFGFNITIDNSNMSEAISLNGEFVLYLENPDSEGQDHGWQGAYNGSNTFVFSNSPVTINAGESQTFSVISSYYIADEDEDGVDEVHWTTISEGLDMQNGVPRNMCDGYTLRVSTYQQDSQSGVWDYGHRNNVKIYIAGAHNGDTVIIRDLSSNVTISNGTTLNFEVISTNGGGNGSNPPQSGNVADITS